MPAPAVFDWALCFLSIREKVVADVLNGGLWAITTINDVAHATNESWALWLKSVHTVYGWTCIICECTLHPVS